MDKKIIRGKLKVLLFQPTLAPYRIDIFNKLSQRFELKVFLEYKASSFEIFSSESFNDLAEFTPTYLKRLFRIRNRDIYGGYWHILKTENPDIVIVSEFGLDALAAIAYKKLFNKNFRIVSICDDSYDMIVSGNDFTKVHKYLRRYVVPQLDDLILVNPQTVHWYQERYKKGIYFPIIANENRVRKEYEKSLAKKGNIIKQHSIKNEKIVLYVGRLIKIKNIRLLIESYIRANIPDTKLIIIGEGSDGENLKQIGQGRNDIIFTGKLSGEDLFVWYNLADIFVLPSLIEPFGAVTNEALIAGCKVLISEKAGSSCLVREKINGYIFDPESKDDLILKLKLICKDLSSEDKDRAGLRESMMLDDYEALSDELIRKLEML